MTGPEARAMVADIVGTALPATWTVYPIPPKQEAAPAAVVAPGTPYRERTTHRTEQVNLIVTFLILEVSDPSATDALDLLLDVVRASLETEPRIMVTSIADLGPASRHGIDYTAGRLELTVHDYQ